MHAAMKSAIFFFLLVATVRGFLKDNSQQQSQQQRLMEKLEKFVGYLEDSSVVLSRKKESLERHADSLQLIADEIDKVHKQVTEDVVFWSGVTAGGNFITIAGAILDYAGKGSPFISVIGQGISLCGGYIKETASSSEQEHKSKSEEILEKIFRNCEEDLHEVADQYREMEEQLKGLEEEGLQGSIFHKKLKEIKRRLSVVQPHLLEKRYYDLKTQLSNFVISLAVKAGAIPTLKEAFSRAPKVTLKDPTSQTVSGLTIKPSNAVSKEIAGPKNPTFGAKSAAIISGVTATASLYQDGKEMYNGIIHLNEGARSVLAENIREVATYLEVVIRNIDRILPKESLGSKS